MNIVICDDELELAEQLKEFILQYFSKQNLKSPNVDVFSSGEACLDSGGNYDIAFLDVEMKGLSGINTGKRLQNKNSDIILFIITSYEEYLDEAMRLRVFRYLSKPIDKKRLFRNLKDAVQVFTTSNVQIAIETKTETVIVKAPEIICMETQGRKLCVHTVKGDYFAVKKMDEWEETLNMNYFFRSHRSFLVNLQHVRRYDHSLIYLDDGAQAYLTKRKYQSFRRALLLYLEGAK